MGLKICRQLQKERITIASDSRLALQIIKKKIKEPWQLRSIMRRILTFAWRPRAEKYYMSFVKPTESAQGAILVTRGH